MIFRIIKSLVTLKVIVRNHEDNCIDDNQNYNHGSNNPNNVKINNNNDDNYAGKNNNINTNTNSDNNDDKNTRKTVNS